MQTELVPTLDFSLQRLNTFGIDARARAYLRIDSAARLAAVIATPALSGMP